MLRTSGKLPRSEYPTFLPPTPAIPSLRVCRISKFLARQGFSTGDYFRLGYSNVANSCDCPLREREQQFQFVNNWTRSTGRHIDQMGGGSSLFAELPLGECSGHRPDTSVSRPARPGLGLATFLIGDVTSFERRTSSPSVSRCRRTPEKVRLLWTGYLADQLAPHLELWFALGNLLPADGDRRGRIPDTEFEQPRPGTQLISAGPPAGGVTGNLTNFAPRLGIAYLINPTTVIRAGYGRSFDAGYAGDIFGIAATQNPPVTVDQNIQAGGFNLANGPPEFILPQPVHIFPCWISRQRMLGILMWFHGYPASGTALYALPSQVRVPTVDSWNLTFQHELTSHLYFELGYVGNKGTHVFADSNAWNFLRSESSIPSRFHQECDGQG